MFGILASTVPYMMWVVVLLGICAALYYRQQQTSTLQTTPEFKNFQSLFLAVYVIMFMADWMQVSRRAIAPRYAVRALSLSPPVRSFPAPPPHPPLQGPYVYALYDDYGFSKGEIGQLFIMGFGASMVFGTVVGGFADKYGRKANCLLFAILYSVGCVTKHFNNYWVLMFGRLMGGISTSILYSAFETWMIHEHKALGFDAKWIDLTFANMTFGSGAVAIIAGLVASFLAASVNLVAPFDASMLLLIAGGFIIATRWRENYGTVDSSSRQTSAWESFDKARRLLLSSERVLLLGVIQSCFESAMYIFVFMCVLFKHLPASRLGADP